MRRLDRPRPARNARTRRDGVRRNFALVHAAVATLGLVPPMLSPEDFLTGGLDEKCVMLYVAHLARRLLELSHEQRAVHVIITALRKLAWERKCGEYGSALRATQSPPWGQGRGTPSAEGVVCR